jgi:tetratricopeptide (TPR) repeat protein
MPKEFAKLQAQDLGKIGATQDLLRGIEKILGFNSKSHADRNAGTSETESSALTQRGNIALEDGDFENAEIFFEQALDANPSDAYAYLGKFLAHYGMVSLSDLDDKVCFLEGSKEFRHAEQFADPALAVDLKNVKDANDIKIERLRLTDVVRKITKEKRYAELEARREAEERAAKEKKMEESYQTACGITESSVEISKLQDAVTIFEHLCNYKDSKERIEECKGKIQRLKKEKLQSEQAALKDELSNLKGLFAGIRRKTIEARLTEISKELTKENNT